MSADDYDLDGRRALTRDGAYGPMSADPVVEPAEKMLAEAMFHWRYDYPDLPRDAEQDAMQMEVYQAQANEYLAASPKLKACIDLGRRIRDENDPLLAEALRFVDRNWHEDQAEATQLRAALLRATEKPKGDGNGTT